MGRLSWEARLAIILVVTSTIIYLVHFVIFHDPEHIGKFMVSDLAFLPIEVLLVSLIVEKVLNERERHIRLEKLNMLIGVFFSEAGTLLLKYFAHLDPYVDSIRKRLIITGDWDDEHFDRVVLGLEDHGYDIEIDRVELEDLRRFLIEKRKVMVRLLANPNLLEHESFTELLQAVFHLTEELAVRPDLDVLPDTDREHLAKDLQRAYVLLVRQWLAYMRHLKDDHPYLFSLAMRTNPFDIDANPVIG
ncbi:MAG: hypothetical protein QF415_00900 [Candidatus Undinarchaeales archaeon]|nr:hypothetical protein [Candidatus Undinarchaeales archaeon]MDP7491853.1 hypothetical protein [Candidatus Undinarchaeales archaeon]